MYKEFDIQLEDVLNDYVDKDYADEFDCSVKLGIAYEMSDYFAATRLQPSEPSEPINLRVDYLEIVDDETQKDETMSKAINECIDYEGDNIAWQLFENDSAQFTEL